MIHRNVLFADGADRTSQVLPFLSLDSDHVEDLWAFLQDYEDRTGGEVIAIPHNGNISGGGMFALTRLNGEPLTPSYAWTRARWEPLNEVTQYKGDGETHPLLSPADSFADFETWPTATNNKFTQALARAAQDAADKARSKGESTSRTGKPKGGLQAGTTEKHSYARSALKLGLEQQQNLGVNPFKFGMIGSTDSHSGLSTADDDGFQGTSGPSPYRITSRWSTAGSGYAAVWATENTRESLVAAMKRRETYATTGPRMVVRFLGGWNFEDEDANRNDDRRALYSKGVPMGGDLTLAPPGVSPSFLVSAVKDPDGANLDRIQVVKGWRHANGELQERVFNVALSDNRKVHGTGAAKAVGNTVNIAEASYTNTIGDAELTAVWEDPDFGRNEPALYYLRVLQIPTPRWTAYDANQFALTDLPEDIPMVIQERAYTSPIWYTPQAPE